MPERKFKLYRTIPSDDVQGEGSYVKIKNMTVEEIVEITGNDVKTGGISNKEAAQIGLKVLDQMIVEWNWVGDDDKPLPIPSETPGTTAALPFQESTWLMEATGLNEMFSPKN